MKAVQFETHHPILVPPDSIHHQRFDETGELADEGLILTRADGQYLVPYAGIAWLKLEPPEPPKEKAKKRREPNKTQPAEPTP